MLPPFSLCGHTDPPLLCSFIRALALGLADRTHPSKWPMLGKVASVLVMSYVRCTHTHTHTQVAVPSTPHIQLLIGSRRL